QREPQRAHHDPPRERLAPRSSSAWPRRRGARGPDRAPPGGDARRLRELERVPGELCGLPLVQGRSAPLHWRLSRDLPHHLAVARRPRGSHRPARPHRALPRLARSSRPPPPPRAGHPPPVALRLGDRRRDLRHALPVKPTVLLFAIDGTLITTG